MEVDLTDKQLAESFLFSLALAIGRDWLVEFTAEAGDALFTWINGEFCKFKSMLVIFQVDHCIADVQRQFRDDSYWARILFLGQQLNMIHGIQ